MAKLKFKLGETIKHSNYILIVIQVRTRDYSLKVLQSSLKRGHKVNDNIVWSTRYTHKTCVSNFDHQLKELIK